MAEIGDEKPQPMPRIKVDPLSSLSITLGDHYKRKRERHAVEAPKTHDRELQRIFSADPRHARAPAASTSSGSNRAKFRRLVSRWTGEYQLTLDAVLDEMIDRCRELKLRAPGSERTAAARLHGAA